MSNDKLCKRYMFNLETVVKGKAQCPIEGPPRMLYLQELLASIPQIFKGLVLDVVRSSPPTAPTEARVLLPTRLLPGATHDTTRTCCRPALSHPVRDAHAQSSRPACTDATG